MGTDRFTDRSDLTGPARPARPIVAFLPARLDQDGRIVAVAVAAGGEEHLSMTDAAEQPRHDPVRVLRQAVALRGIVTGAQAPTFGQRSLTGMIDGL